MKVRYKMQFRYWLIKLLARGDAIIMNAHFSGDIKLLSKKGVVYNCVCDAESNDAVYEFLKERE